MIDHEVRPELERERRDRGVFYLGVQTYVTAYQARRRGGMLVVQSTYITDTVGVHRAQRSLIVPCERWLHVVCAFHTVLGIDAARDRATFEARMPELIHRTATRLMEDRAYGPYILVRRDPLARP